MPPWGHRRNFQIPMTKRQAVILPRLTLIARWLDCAGGILADDQGLGKTVSTIALLVSSLPPRAPRVPVPRGRPAARAPVRPADARPAPAIDGIAAAASAPDSGSAVIGGQRQGAAPIPAAVPAAEELVQGGTLVVCPIAVLHQWSRELTDKVSTSAGACSALPEGIGCRGFVKPSH